MSDIPHEAIERALRTTLGPHGLDHVESKVGFDHDGDPALFVHAILAPNSPLVPGEVYAAANVALNETLNQRGDREFVYLQIQHPDDERPEDATPTGEPVGQ